jgi:DNA-binding transcriptional LysR family regulator
MPFGGLSVFLAVAEHGSLRKAAAALGVQPPAISYQLKALEQRIGADLFARTTRSVRLTDAGQALLARAGPALAELGDALEDARNASGATRGTIRLTLPYVAYEMTIARKLRAFQLQFPHIELDLSFDEAFVDMVAEGFHAGIRLGDHIQQDMVAVRLCPPFKETVFAAPSYLHKHGRPRQPKDLLQHSCIRYRYIASGRFAEWRFKVRTGVIAVDVNGSLIVNSTSALVSAALDGIGIGWLFQPAVEKELSAGKLESVLSGYCLEQPGYFLYFPRSSSRAHAFKTFVEFMRG